MLYIKIIILLNAKNLLLIYNEYIYN
jgi:hypothetical protein